MPETQVLLRVITVTRRANGTYETYNWARWATITKGKQKAGGAGGAAGEWKG
jgi:hypothetical protein